MTRVTSFTIPLLIAGSLTLAIDPRANAADVSAGDSSAAEPAAMDAAEALHESTQHAAKPRLGTLGGRTGIDAEIESDGAAIEGAPGLDPEEEEEARSVASCGERKGASR